MDDSYRHTATMIRLQERNLGHEAWVCSRAHYVTIAQMLSGLRKGAAVAARHDLWRQLRDKYGLAYRDIGDMFSVGSSTVFHGVRKAKKRDD